jgi:sec-independent protein translocase protein TatA
MRLGMGEIVVVLALALLFFGPSKLPQLGASLGSAIKGFKKAVSGGDEPEEEKKLPAPSETQRVTDDQSVAAKSR